MSIKGAESADGLLNITVRPAGLFWAVEGGHRWTYAQAGAIEGAPVYGRGVRLVVTLMNQAPEPLEVLGLNVRATFHETYPADLRYDKLGAPVPLARLPLAGERGRVRLTEAVIEPGVTPVRGTRRVLAPCGDAGAEEMVEVTVEAAVSGLWAFTVQAVCTSRQGLFDVEPLEDFLVLLRGV